ncbi:hypothetical protein I317_06113 [Kwoniella heveanensis CBS 569]|nr:hypothetical protein I317_06113 [Kwoniella heveanensis CBS 569]
MHRSHSPPTHPTLPGLWLPVYLFNAVIYREVSGQSVTVSATATPTSTADADSDLDSNSGGCEYDGSVTDYLSCAKDKISTTTLIGAGIGVTLGIFALAFLCIWLTKRKRISAANQTSIGQRRSPTDFEDLEGRRKSNYLVPEITWDGASEKGQDVEDDQRTGSDTKKGRSSAIPPVPPILDLKRSNTQRSHHATATQKDRLRHDSSQSATSQNFHPQQATTRDPTAPQAEDATSMSEEGTHTSMVRKPSRRIPPPSILKDGTGVGATQDRSSALSHSRSLSDTPTPSGHKASSDADETT